MSSIKVIFLSRHLHKFEHDISKIMSADKMLNEIGCFITKLRTIPECANLGSSEANRIAQLFLRARKMDVDRAFALYKANKRMRYTEQIDTIDPYDEGVRQELLSGKLSIHTPSSQDEFGRTLVIFTVKLHWPPSTTHRDTLKAVLFQLDAAMTSEHAQKNGIDLLYDMRDARYANFDFNLCVKLLTLLKGNYPIRLANVFVLEAPPWFRYSFDVLRLFVDEKLRKRVYLIAPSQLDEHLTSDQIGKVLNPNKTDHLAWVDRCLAQQVHSSSTTTSPCIDLDWMRPWWYNKNGFISPQSYYQYTNGDSDDHHANRSSSLRRPLGGFARGGEGINGNGFQTLPRLTTIVNGRCILDGSGSSYQRSRSIAAANRHYTSNNSNNKNGNAQLPPTNVTNPQSPTRLTVGQFVDHMKDKQVLHRLEQEFDHLFGRPDQGVKTSQCREFRRPENRSRNRYTDVPCLDVSMLELPDQTYLHANWVNGYQSPRAYIMAQGPLETTCRDFWLAVWQYRVPLILMLTRLFEGHRLKCSPYWPTLYDHSHHHQTESASDQPCLQFGEFQVTNLGESQVENGLFVRTRLRLELITGGDSSSRHHHQGAISSSFDLVHLLYTGWPDYDIPVNPTSNLLTLIDTVKQEMSATTPSDNHHQSRPPMLVHCSAGIGRTGTYVALDILLKQALNEGFVDVVDVVKGLRSQRAGAVQLAKQYLVLHQALASRLACSKH